MAKKNKTTKASELPDDFLQKVKSVTAKRAKTVIDHILEHGFVTTEELSELYGYDHAPRAARDVRELGIPLETYRVAGKNGRKIAAYCFGEPLKVCMVDLVVGRLGQNNSRVNWFLQTAKDVQFASPLMKNAIFRLTIARRTKLEAIQQARWISPTTCFCAVPAIAPNLGHVNIAGTGRPTI